MNLIGISGKIGCGKSTLAHLVAQRLGWAVTSFGARLKDEVAQLFGFSRSSCDTPEGKDRIVDLIESPWAAATLAMTRDSRATMSVRELLQVWGTDVRRAQDPDYWVRSMRGFLESEGGGWVLDDLRFPNEAALVREQGLLLVRLEPYPGWEPGPHAGHLSETALDDFQGWDLILSPLKGELDRAADLVAMSTALAVCQRIAGLNRADALLRDAWPGVMHRHMSTLRQELART